MVGKNRSLTPKESSTWTGIFVGLALIGLLAAGGIGGTLVQLPAMQAMRQSAAELLSLDSVQLMWFITRASGLTGYVLLWLSTVWGLVVSSKALDALLHRSFTYDFHEFLSLLAIGFIGVHIAVLMADHYLPFTLSQILVPFLAPYRPFWVGIGVLAFYLTLLVTVTFYMRRRIGMRAFRWIHLSSFLAFLGAAGHGLMAGTDSSLPLTQVLYASTLLVVVFLTTYWATLRLLTKW
jgi:predicted ferric reductase